MPYLIIYIFNKKLIKNTFIFLITLSILYFTSFLNATDNKILEIRNNSSYLHSNYYLNHFPFSIQNTSFKNFKDCIEKNCLIYLDMPKEHNLEAQHYTSLVLGIADFERFIIKDQKNNKFLYSINPQINYDLQFENELIMKIINNKFFDVNDEFLGKSSYFKSNEPVSVDCFAKLDLFGRNYRLNKVVCKK